MAAVDANGNLTYAGGRYRHNRLVGRTTSFGTYCLVADTIPPTITPQFEEGQDCRAKNRIALRLTDNFAGIASYNAWIDSEWVAIDFLRGRAWINLSEESISGKKTHTLKFEATDNCGNKTTWEGNFIR